jgi:hypothetical protein
MIQTFLPVPTIPHSCSICTDQVHGFHEHDVLTEKQTVLGCATEIQIHFNHGSIARELWDRFKWKPFDWDKVLYEMANIKDEIHGIPPHTIQVHTEERTIWLKARRRRLTYDYVIYFDGEEASYHIYLSTTGDVPFEAKYVFTSIEEPC